MAKFRINPITGEFDLDAGVTDHGLLTGLLDDDHTQYVVLTGRSGQSNSPLLSSDNRGSIIGSAVHGAGLGLSPVSGTVLQGGDTIRLAPDITTITGQNWLTSVLQDLSFDASAEQIIFGTQSLGIASVFPPVGSTWTLTDTTNAVQFLMRVFAPLLMPPVGENRDLGFLYGEVFSPHFKSDGGILTLGIGEAIVCCNSEPGFETANGGSIAFSGFGLAGFVHELRGLGGATGSAVLPFNYGFYHFCRTEDPLSVIDDVAFRAEGNNFAPLGINASLQSTDHLKVLRHGGPGVFGADQNPTTGSVGLELAGTDKAFLVSRLSTSDITALVATNGMIVYNTTDDKFQGYENGAWVNLV